jgi:hypothetical protein
MSFLSITQIQNLTSAGSILREGIITVDSDNRVWFGAELG